MEQASPKVKALRLRKPYGAVDLEVEVCGEKVPAVFDGAFLRIERKFKTGDTVKLSFGLADVTQEPEPGAVKRLVGPLLYGTEGDAPATPVYHLLDPKVSKASGYSKVIIR